MHEIKPWKNSIFEKRGRIPFLHIIVQLCLPKNFLSLTSEIFKCIYYILISAGRIFFYSFYHFTGEESFKVDLLEYLVDAFITLISFITRTSYIGTNIIMMVSIFSVFKFLMHVLRNSS